MLTSLFKPKTTATIMQEQLDEAERLRVEHIAAAEHHQALADMYVRRAVRLREDIEAETAVSALPGRLDALIKNAQAHSVVQHDTP